MISIRLAKLFLEKPALASIGLCFIERQAPIFVQVCGVEGGFTPICPGNGFRVSLNFITVGSLFQRLEGDAEPLRRVGALLEDANLDWGTLSENLMQFAVVK